MNTFFIGNTLVGNFKPTQDVEKTAVSSCKLEKITNSLYLVDGDNKIRLNPVDDDSVNMINVFGEGTPEVNPSIYKINKNGALVVVILYTNTGLISLKDEGKMMAIHLRIDDERSLFREGRLSQLFDKSVLRDLLVEGVIGKRQYRSAIDGYFSKEGWIQRIRSKVGKERITLDLDNCNKDEVVDYIIGNHLLNRLLDGKERGNLFDENNLSTAHLSSDDEVVPLLTEVFVNNGSIFVSATDAVGRYVMYGNGCIAELWEERPGVYEIHTIRKNYRKENIVSLTQIYGGIKILLYNDSLKERGNENVIITSAQTNQIIRAWDEYMAFKVKIYGDNLSGNIISFRNIDVKDGRTVVYVNNPNLDYDVLKDIDFEFVTRARMPQGKKMPCNTEEILEMKKSSEISPVFLGRMKGSSDGAFFFDIPRRDYADYFNAGEGIMYESDFMLKMERRRRQAVINEIDSKKNQTANTIMRLSDPELVDYQFGGDLVPIKKETLKSMFGNTDVDIKEPFRHAMDIALNTPDIALIQGPPGTGKTTVIKGIVSRLKMEKNRDCHILVTSEQHEALYNVVNKMSGDTLMPPFISSTKYDSDEDDDRFRRNIESFQRNCIELCETILNDCGERDEFSSVMTSTLTLIQEIRDEGYNKTFISGKIDELEEKLGIIGIDASASMVALKMACGNNTVSGTRRKDPRKESLVREIQSQLLDVDAFMEDGGQDRLRDLTALLRVLGKDGECLSDHDYDILIGNDRQGIEQLFPLYCQYVQGLKEKYVPRVISEFGRDIDLKGEIESIYRKIADKTRERDPSLHDIIEEFILKISDIDAASDAVKRYTSVVGSTCAQANRSGSYAELPNGHFDYVIVDEAARANPLDLMIPIMKGTRVLLVGDHFQLPHYIETEVIAKMKEGNADYSKYDVNLLTKSLFQIIYENLEKAYKEKRIKYPRTAMIQEQHRMHGSIGDFISKEFYKGALTNGKATERNVNDYGVFDGANVVYVDIPFTQGMEKRISQSLCRPVEVERALSIMNEILVNNKDRDISIGVISFYSGQVELLQNLIEEKMPEKYADCISCGTVDSYQGREFDVVILTGVRSNTERKLGFIQNSSSRVNVALSRARRLLVFVGDTNTFKGSEHFRNFFDYVEKVGYHE